MKILLTSTASHLPPRGGATRSNLAWLRTLVQAGHACRVVGGAIPEGQRGRSEQLEQEGAGPDGIEIFSVLEPSRRLEVLREQVREFHPDWVLVSTEDLGQVLLREAMQCAPGRVIYLAHTPQWFPFGPASWSRDPRGADLVRRCAGIIAIGRHMAAYIREHLGVEPTVIHPPIYPPGPYPNLARFGDGLITMINPCAVKGISLFLEIARRSPHRRFGVLPGWGTTAADRAALAALPNVEFLPHCRDIEDFLRRSSILLMPSLWLEGFGLIVMEAMLRGIPVISSDSGGLKEAKEGTGYVIPVREITEYENVFDEHGMPRPVVPPQDPTPWLEAVESLAGDEEAYRRESEASRAAAERFVASVDPSALERYLASLAPKPLRILLAQNSPYYPAHGGGDRSNRLLVEALAARGHSCLVVARTASYGPDEHRRYVEELERRGVAVTQPDPGVAAFTLNGVPIRVVTNHANLRAYFSLQIETFEPDIILASTDDPAQLLLEAALKARHARVVYLSRATLALPFGPDCAFPSPKKAAILRQVDAAVGVSEYVAAYMRQWGEMEAVHVPISLMEPGPYPRLGSLENEFVTLVNPCAVKGITIFTALASRFPEVRFAAVPTWGTNEADLAALRAHPNITILPPVDRIDDLLARTRILLVPSLWAEARSRIIVEAMLRGIPVLASDIGGIPEAKMGVPYLLPVRPIEHYRPKLDEQMVPVAEVPEQDIEPWAKALQALLSDPAHYEDIASRSREAAHRYVENLNILPFEDLLKRTLEKPRKAPAALAPAASRLSLLESLSPEKRRLLALRLKKKAESSAEGHWFAPAALSRPARLRLFCFPHAGGGIATFHGWSDALPHDIAVCPARLPGRESRAGETPFRRMEDLVAALLAALSSHLETPFALFGHSMGAAVAFELARALRKSGLPQPVGLFVSAARAPQFRRGWTPPPEPSDEDFLNELRRLQGVPREILENRELMRLILPALKADAALYRHYVYQDEPPLNCPIRAYGGETDPNITREHLEAWREQTTASFHLRMFPGGHFFHQTVEEDFLKALAADLLP